jgi:hypothetical protein
VLFVVVRRVLTTLLFGVRPEDPVSIVAAVGLLLAAMLAPAWLAAVRVSQVDPGEPLRWSQ